MYAQWYLGFVVNFVKKGVFVVFLLVRRYSSCFWISCRAILERFSSDFRATLERFSSKLSSDSRAIVEQLRAILERVSSKSRASGRDFFLTKKSKMLKVSTLLDKRSRLGSYYAPRKSLEQTLERRSTFDQVSIESRPSLDNRLDTDGR